jgi:hypothetical protein
MQILSLDLSKYKNVACDYEAETGRHSFATVATTPSCWATHLVNSTHPIEALLERVRFELHAYH